MIPKLVPHSTIEQVYLDFFAALRKTAFTGDIAPDYANRTVLATDNSVYQILPQGVIYPRSTEDLVILCETVSLPEFHQVVFSPRGGGTGTNGQSLTDGVVVDISKHMNQVIEVNAKEGWARVQTGVVKDQLNAALKPHGLFFAPDLSTSNRATIGGMINTDASGQGSCLYGKTRDHVIELQTVLLDGSVMTTHAESEEDFTSIAANQDRTGLIYRLVNSIEQEFKDQIQTTFPPLNRCMTGYDLAHIRDQQGRFNLNNILCGSEGTLGFIAEAKLNVIALPKRFGLVIVKYDNFDSSLRDATELMKSSPTSIETIDSKVLNLAMNDFIWNQVEAFFNDETPVPVQGINLVEFTADSETELKTKIDAFIEKISSKGSQTEQNNNARIGYATAIGKNNIDKIWAMRKRAVGLLGNAKGEARPVPFVEDTAVPPEHLADFIMEFREILDAYKLQYGMFGHVDAGVLHVRPALDMKDPAQEAIAWEISDRIADLTHQYHGVLWGEHGKGVRSEYAPKFFGELYPQLQRIKASFDPHNQLNPGKIATPSETLSLLKIDEVTTRGSLDRVIASDSWTQYSDAVYCNGNGACFNWNHNDPMCPSWKATRKRTHSPKGRASLIREWLSLLSEKNAKAADDYYQPNLARAFINFPRKLINSLGHRNNDFSHEVYDSMAACLACKSCAGQCPIKVNVPEFRSKFLASYHTRYLRPLKDHLVGALEFLLPICARVKPVYNGFMNNGLFKQFLEKVVGFVDGPTLSKTSLKKAGLKFVDDKELPALTEQEKRKTVVLVQDAFTSYFESELVIAIYQLLEKLGFSPRIAPFMPNGKPLHVHGYLKKFTQVANKNATVLNKIASNGVALVGIDPSMTLTYRGEYEKYVSEEIEAPKVQLLQEWLSENLDLAQPIENQGGTTRFRLLPHCTEKTNAASSVKQWQTIFAHFGLELKVENVGCCGMSGTFGHETRNKNMSQTLYKQSWENIVKYTKEKESLIVTGYSCRSQVKRESNVELKHPLQAILQQLNPR